MRRRVRKTRSAIHVIGPSIAYIALTRDQFALVDAEDAEPLAKFNWHALWNQKTQSFYAARAVYSEGHKATIIGMHRQVSGCEEGSTPDHVNRTSLDNRRINLRSATPSQQSCNQRLRSDNTSGYRGVGWDAMYGKWAAFIYVNGKRRRLGRYHSKEEAARAYDEAAKRLHGEFASLNMEEAA